MSAELIAIVAAAIALAGLILTVTGRLSTRLAAVERQMTDVRERIARLEGVFGHIFRRGEE